MTKRKVRTEETPVYIDAVRDAGNLVIASALAIIDSRIKERVKIADPTEAGEYIKVMLHGLEHEVFVAFFLNSRHEILGHEELFRGTIDGAEIHPREVVKAALRYNAAAVLFGHNHPSGSLEVSGADKAVTTRLKQALTLVDIRVLDHFIIGDGPPTSMAQKGML